MDVLDDGLVDRVGVTFRGSGVDGSDVDCTDVAEWL